MPLTREQEMRAAQRRASMSAEEWNARYPVGTPVAYRPVWGDPDGEQTRTRSEAWTLGHGEAVVMIEGRAGGVALWALTVLQTNA